MVTAARMLARAIAFPFRFGLVRRMGAIALVAAAIGGGVAAAILRWTGARGDAFTAAFIFMYAVAIVLLIAVWISLERLRRRDARTLGELLALTPAEFETAVARMLRGRGYRDVSVVGGPGDLAADILCRDPKGRSIAVQCKRKAPGQRVGSAEVQKFIGMISVHHQADAGIFVTTSEFTQPAIDLADRHGIMLLDGGSLSRMTRRRERRVAARPARRTA